MCLHTPSVDTGGSLKEEEGVSLSLEQSVSLVHTHSMEAKGDQTLQLIDG